MYGLRNKYIRIEDQQFSFLMDKIFKLIIRWLGNDIFVKIFADKFEARYSFSKQNVVFVNLAWLSFIRFF